MFETGITPPFEHTVGDPLRMARRVYGRLQFSWPSQADATAFRRLFPLSLKLPNSRPVLLKEFVDRFEEFTAPKAAGTPTLSIRNVPMEYAPEDIRTFLLDSIEPDGAHWLADLTNFHRASDPYEGTYFTHLAGLPVATPDDPHFNLIPFEILLEVNTPPMLLNFSCHVCALCSNNHRALLPISPCTFPLCPPTCLPPPPATHLFPAHQLTCSPPSPALTFQYPYVLLRPPPPLSFLSCSPRLPTPWPLP
ncbi:unnamed protein product [Closterium sp. NIES-65]|nr:unnamed protein product [Closterium sp. NIES-65]